MITGFESYTYDLTDNEKELVPLFVRSFQKRIGKENAVTATDIQKKLIISGPRIRKIIHYITVNYLVRGLIGTSNGYYISKDKEEVKRAILSLGQREEAIRQRRLVLEEYLKSL